MILLSDYDVKVGDVVQVRAVAGRNACHAGRVGQVIGKSISKTDLDNMFCTVRFSDNESCALSTQALMVVRREHE